MRAVVGFVAISVLGLGGVAIGDFGTQSAMASDNKIVSGHACMSLNRYSQTDRSNPEFIENTGNLQTYMCPVVRDDPNGNLDFVRVRTYDNNSHHGDPVMCTVWAVSVDGTSSNASSVQTTTGGLETLEFALNGFIEFDYGHYVIECSMGTGDQIVSYRTNED
ncbi:hypothetical protein [Enhygromyxa salina]|nr:hypothetical protein [Enhygromyxa salina]